MDAQTLYKLDPSRHYAQLGSDPRRHGQTAPGATHLGRDRPRGGINPARTASPSLILHRLGSYARQHSVHQPLNEIGRVERTVHILPTIDEEEYRR